MGLGLILLLVCVLSAWKLKQASAGGRFHWHDILEGGPLAFCLLVVLAVVAGGIAELVPGIVVQKKVPLAADGSLAVKPYTRSSSRGATSTCARAATPATRR